MSDLGRPMPPSAGTLSILLQHVPLDERTNVIRELLRSLKPDDEPSLRFVASLVKQDGSDALAKDLASFVEDAIEADQVKAAVGFCLQDQRLCSTLLARVIDKATEAKSSASSFNSLQSWLLFATLTIPHSPFNEASGYLLLAALEILNSNNDETHRLAKDIVLGVLRTLPDDVFDVFASAKQDTIWSNVRMLVASDTPLQALTGYSIWLQWLLALSRSGLNVDADNNYWQPIIQGLRRGDMERRKLCLNILKLTVAHHSTTASEELARQYNRYATVFETIVIGRYMNQVLECEKDLDFFASDDSVLEPLWLFTLLGAALENSMQDSNRKFIGNWVMRSAFSFEPSFLDFFEKDFIPWATQGQHFVATLEQVHGQAVCRHGEQLADLIKRLCKACSSPKRITDAVVDALLRMRNSMFAYCTVYLLNGLDDSMSEKQRTDLATLRGLPEVANDFVASKALRSGVVTSHVSTRRSREQEVFDKIAELDPTTEAVDEIWSDVEYLEFPKRLLMVLPSSLLARRTLEAARTDAKLAASIAQKSEVLRQVATTKTYLFPPLATALRTAIHVDLESAQYLELAQIIIRVAEQPPHSTIDLMLEDAVIPLTSHSYKHYYGERLSYGFASYLDMISRLQGQQPLIQTALVHILHQWRLQKTPPPVVSTWKNALQLQVLLLCFEQHQSPSHDEQLSVLDDVFYILAVEPLPSYRYLLEVIIVRMILRHELGHVLVERLQTKDHHSNPKHLASLMKIGATLACTQSATEDFAHQIATTFVPLAASSKVVIRHEAQWQMPILMDHARERGWKTIADNTALIALDDYIRSLERFNDPPAERLAGKFDPMTDFTMANIVEGRWFDLDKTESPLTSYDEFVKLHSQEPLPEARTPCLPLGSAIARHLSREAQPPLEWSALKPVDKFSAALQTKGTANLARSLLSSAIPTRPSPHLIIVGSLVDNPYNLGGLSRVSEIFGAGTLTLPNTNVTSNKDFLSVSVSSHLHIPIVPVPTTTTAEWVRTKRSEGYTIVGIEQTDRSVVLGSSAALLPEKCVLVVGNEREGIPGEVLIACDTLVEIEQRGITRSMNVQTAVACVAFEYCRQHESA